MTDATPTDGSTADAETTLHDPTTLLDRDDVEVTERRADVDDDHLENTADWAGMAVVGVTDDAGRLLLLEREDGDHAILPHGPVDPGEDFAAVARRAVAETATLPATIAGVERVRRVELRHVDDPDRTASRFDVLFRATPTDDAPAPSSDRDDWDATWRRTVPDNPDWDHDDVVNDIRAFLG